jgi:hypothetical protein
MVKSEYMHLSDPKAPHHVHYGLNLTDHIPHCFDYIRQGIMCAGDTALEHSNFHDGHHDFLGWDVKHVCRDYDTIVEWARERRVDDHGDIV